MSGKGGLVTQTFGATVALSPILQLEGSEARAHVSRVLRGGGEDLLTSVLLCAGRRPGCAVPSDHLNSHPLMGTPTSSSLAPGSEPFPT